jgi:hypothetical protein
VSWKQRECRKMLRIIYSMSINKEPFKEIQISQYTQNRKDIYKVTFQQAPLLF